MYKTVKTIDFGDYRAEVKESQDTTGMILFFVYYYWKDIFIFLTPSKEIPQEKMENHALKRLKDFDCAEIDEDRYSFFGDVYYLPNYKKENLCLL